MCRGMNGLALQVQQVLGRDPHAGDFYVFRGKRGDLFNVLWHDGLGMSLYTSGWSGDVSCGPHRRMLLTDGSSLRLRPSWPGHVCAYDCVQDRTREGRKFRILTVMDEFSREYVPIAVARRLTADDALQVLADLFVEQGPPDHISSDNGPEFVAKAVRAWLGQVRVKTLFIEPGSPWENSYNECFNGKLPDELLDREIFSTLHEAKVLIKRWRWHCNAVQPQSALDYCPPALQTIFPCLTSPAYAALRHAQPGAPWHGPTLSWPVDPRTGAGQGYGDQSRCHRGPTNVSR